MIMSSSKWIISKEITNKKYNYNSAGFTLIELLVGIIISALVITPLLGFMINIMQTERREQAQTTTEQDLRSAIDFISRDLEQAVYIYDAEGIAAIKSQLPSRGLTKEFPVLVFWKRQYINKAIPIKGNNCNNASNCDDTFVYSLVAYYLIKDDNSTWSKTARIGRFQISDGYGENDTQKNNTRDAGFRIFDLQGRGDLKTKMNKWTKNGSYQQKILPLVDYIDQTTIDQTREVTPPTCPSGMQQIPDFSGTITGAAASGAVRTGSFYACVDSLNTVAEVYLRGNSLARIQGTPPTYNQQKKTYFPQASVRVKGRGFIFTK